MITKDNFKNVLRDLNFNENSNYFIKQFPHIDAYLKVDFDKKELIYPTDKGFHVHGEFTCNFSSNENFVVFECVNRLFEKGYKPEHLELEPKWKVGHGASGGRADIMVKDNSGKALLIIECKTEGIEFTKEWNNTLQRGGQMLTYVKQAGTTQFVCLYASDFADNKVVFKNHIITLNDNITLLNELKDKKPLSFTEAKALEVEDIHKAWKETYQLDFATKGIFENDIRPYEIGKLNYTIDDLVEIGSKDIQSKYHEFATILRQHNVSGRENAFDKLVNLFLCKIVDEFENPNDLKFNWKGIAYDNYFDLTDRLQTLYQTGMAKFLAEKVTNVNKAQITEAFRFVKNDPDATQETILKFFRELKYFKNNDFSFIDVHNERLFYENAVVLLEIVKMLQDTRLKTENQNQFLGDMFEGFLDQGVKQSEGQFFTPMPIVKFIMQSLPLESIIVNSDMPPKAIDYACGAGHFLNELAQQIKPLVALHKKTDIGEYYKEIVGIEKEYRLSKVAKVSAFMYGQDDINITYNDALAKNDKIENDSFSILVANPPYSVKGFLQTLSESDRKAFELTKTIEEKSLPNNNSIETFFIERAKQLLKPGAVAGIILPSSILSNDSKIYSTTREIIIKYFEIVSIVEFGSQTFGKTGTNTVTLFLRRKEDNPAPAEHWQNRVESWFSNNEGDKQYKDNHLIDKYCNHIGIDADCYKTLLKGKPSSELLATEMFAEYKKEFDKKKQSLSAKFNKEEKDAELLKRFIQYITEIEKDKLYYFVSAAENRQRVLVVKCPSDNKEQKQFLGYEWSSAKGNEGIKYINQTSVVKVDDDDEEAKIMLSKLNGLHNINTPLYNPNNRADANKINHYIEQNFLGNELDIPGSLNKYVAYYSLTDMLDFSRKELSKQISLTPQRTSPIVSKWKLVKLGDVVDVKIGGTPARENSSYFNGENLWVSISEMKGQVINDTKEKITKLGIQKSNVKLIHKGTTLLSFKLSIGKTAIAGKDLYTNEAIAGLIPKDKELLLDSYVYQLFNTKQIDLENTGLKAFGQSLNSAFLKEDVIIPLPPIDEQAKIVTECEAIDAEVIDAEKSIEECKRDIERKFESAFEKSNLNFKLSNEEIFDVSIGKRVLKNEINSDGIGIPVYSANVFEAFGHISKKHLDDFTKSSVLWGIDGDWMVNCIAAGTSFYPTDHCGVLRMDETKILPKYLAWVLNMEGIRVRFSRQNRASIDRIKGLNVQAPPIEEQIKLVAEIEQLEHEIAIEQIKINSSAEKKKEIMKKFL